MISVSGSRWSTRRLVTLALRWTVPAAILLAFVVTGHLGDAFLALSGVSLWWGCLLVFVGIALPLSHAWRWCYLLRRVDAEVSMAGSAQVTVLASLLNYAAPGFLGAPAKAIFARDSYHVPISRSLPTLAAEQMLDAALLGIGSLLAIVITGPIMYEAVVGTVLIERTLTAFLIVVAVGALAVILWMLGKRFLPGFVTSVSEATVMLMQSGEYLRPITALTLTRWVLDMAAIAIASIAVGLRLSLLEILLVANLSLLIGLIAPVPGGLGVREAVMASLAGVVGVSIPAMLALSVLHRAGLAVGLPIVLSGSRVREWSAR